MPGVTIEYFAQARAAAGCDSETLDAETIGGLVEAACAAHGDALRAVLLSGDGAIAPWLMVVHNGRAQRDSRATRLKEGDVVRLLPPISGG